MRRWAICVPLIAIAIFLAAAIAWLDRDPRIPRQAFQPFSVHNTTGRGLSIAARYLEEGTSGTVDTLSRPMERTFVEPNAVIFRIAPESSVPPGLQRPDVEGAASTSPWMTPGEEKWIRSGGRLVLALRKSYGTLRPRRADKGPTKKVFPLWQDVATLSPPERRILGGPPIDASHTLFSIGGGPLVIRSRLDKGDVFFLTCPEVFQNERLGKANHLEFLLRLAGPNRPVYFDEFVHGMESRAGVLEILGAWGFGPFLVLGLAAALVAFGRNRLRVGPREDDAEETRVEAIDFVDSLALLYNRTLPRRQALRLYLQTFRESVSLRTGLRGPALEARVRELHGKAGLPTTRGQRDVGAYEFQRELDSINDAFRRLEDAKRPGNQR